MGCIKPPLAVSAPTQRASGRLAFGRSVPTTTAPAAQPQAAAETAVNFAKQQSNRAATEIQNATTAKAVERSLANAKAAIKAAMAKSNNPSEKQSLRDRLRNLEAKAASKTVDLTRASSIDLHGAKVTVPDYLKVDHFETIATRDRFDVGWQGQPNTAYVYNQNWAYLTNEDGALVHSVGVYTPTKNAPRHPDIQLGVGRAGNASTGTNNYVGGHPGAVTLGGGHPSMGLFPQNSNNNVSAFKSYENEAASLAKNGHVVIWEVALADDTSVPSDKFSSTPPSVILLTTTVDGVRGDEVPLLNVPHQFK